jgi:pSer/pThr/pTyr-binding forkhead associated (FHA) protein
MLHGGYPLAAPSTEIAPRARLIVITKDGAEGASYPIGESMDVGRAEGHVTIPEDRFLSPRHARIFRRATDGRLVLRDLSSTNGIYVRLRAQASSTGGSIPRPRLPSQPDDALALGGLRSEAHTLADQDLFLVGQQVLRFEVVSDARGEEGLGPASQHGTLLFGTPAAPRYARLSQRTVEGVSRDVFYIRKAETVLGRESGDIVFTEDPFLSRRHAAIRVDPAHSGAGQAGAGHAGGGQDSPRRFLLADLGSSNGTFVQLRGEVVLQSGDQFRIGQQLFRIDIA